MKNRSKLKRLARDYARHPAGDGQGRGGQFAPKETKNIPFGATGKSIAARYLTEDQRQAIEKYQNPATDHYKTINSQLRGWTEPNDNVQKDIQNISDGLSALPPPDYEQIEGYRGHLNRFGNHIYNHVAFAKSYPSVGSEFEESAFLSTTITHGNDRSMAAFTGEEAILAKLNIRIIPKTDGTTNGRVMPFGTGTEKEILFNKGTRFRVESSDIEPFRVEKPSHIDDDIEEVDLDDEQAQYISKYGKVRTERSKTSPGYQYRYSSGYNSVLYALEEDPLTPDTFWDALPDSAIEANIFPVEAMRLMPEGYNKRIEAEAHPTKGKTTTRRSMSVTEYMQALNKALEADDDSVLTGSTGRWIKGSRFINITLREI